MLRNPTVVARQQQQEELCNVLVPERRLHALQLLIPMRD
jgi:hypothetical protein